MSSIFIDDSSGLLGREAGYMSVDARGTPFAGGGLSADMRDIGRPGLSKKV